MIRLRFIHRTGCHLCEAMWAELDGIRTSGGVEFELVDLARDTHLEPEYGDKIPLLFHGEQELCRYFLDEEKVRAYLDIRLQAERVKE